MTVLRRQVGRGFPYLEFDGGGKDDDDAAFKSGEYTVAGSRVQAIRLPFC